MSIDPVAYLLAKEKYKGTKDKVGKLEHFRQLVGTNNREEAFNRYHKVKQAIKGGAMTKDQIRQWLATQGIGRTHIPRPRYHRTRTELRDLPQVRPPESEPSRRRGHYSLAPDRSIRDSASAMRSDGASLPSRADALIDPSSNGLPLITTSEAGQRLAQAANLDRVHQILSHLIPPTEDYGEDEEDYGEQSVAPESELAVPEEPVLPAIPAARVGIDRSIQAKEAEKTVPSVSQAQPVPTTSNTSVGEKTYDSVKPTKSKIKSAEIKAEIASLRADIERAMGVKATKIVKSDPTDPIIEQESPKLPTNNKAAAKAIAPVMTAKTEATGGSVQPAKIATTSDPLQTFGKTEINTKPVLVPGSVNALGAPQLPVAQNRQEIPGVPAGVSAGVWTAKNALKNPDPNAYGFDGGPFEMEGNTDPVRFNSSSARPNLMRYIGIAERLPVGLNPPASMVPDITDNKFDYSDYYKVRTIQRFYG